MGLIEYKNNQQMESEEAATLQAETDARDRQTRNVITSLGGYVSTFWTAARDAKRDIEDVMLDSLRRKNGIYDPVKLAEIQKHGGSKIFMMLTDERFRLYHHGYQTFCSRPVKNLGESSPRPNLN